MVPDGWEATQLGELARFTSGGTPSKKNISYWGGGYPWISGKDLKQHYLSDSIDTLTKEGFAIANKKRIRRKISKSVVVFSKNFNIAGKGSTFYVYLPLAGRKR